MINEPRVTVTCDGCGYTPEDAFEMTAVVGHDPTYTYSGVVEELEKYGWTLPDGARGKTYCEDCSGERV